MGVVPGGGKIPDGKEPFTLAKVGGQEGCHTDHLDDGGKRMGCQEIKCRSSYQALFILYKTPASSCAPQIY